jgi:hypothetical protein
MPYLAKARSLARLLVVAGQLRECQGDAAGAVKQYLAAVRLGCDVAQGGSVVSSLVDVACADLGLTALEGCMRTLPDDPPLWKAILGQMAMIEKRRWPLANALRVETLGGERTFSMLMTGQVDLRELNDDLGGLRLTRDDLNRSKLTYLAYMSALIRAAEGGFTAFREKMPMAKDRVRDDPLTGLLVNALDRVFFVTSRARFRLDAFRLMAALRLWKSVKHAYPNDLAELVPDYLPVVPRDPFADAALRYVLTGDKVMIYSVGPDGDDDKGQVECPSEQLGPDTNGDLVLRMPK